ncbi:MAG: response regulator [Planctomycetes bacterium]|nr:response regulator [Planctomycetota bacterium]
MLSDEEIIAQIGEGLPVGVWVARAPHGEFVYANETFRQIMGLPGLAEVARGEYAEPYRIYDRGGALYPESSMPFVRALEARETVMVDDIVIHRRDGARVNVRAYARPVFEEGEITHVVIAFFDITREVEAEAARAESEARLHQAERMQSLGTLAGGIAHDVNNLLGAISLIASSLAMDEADEERRADLDKIEEVVQTATDLARSLLTFAGRGKNLAAPVSLNDVVRSVERIFVHGIDKRIQVTNELRASRGVMGDYVRLEQVVMNLFLNARDAMPEGGRIRVSTRDEGPEVVVEVEDEGAGIPRALRRRVFDPFFTTKQGGPRTSTGLGLATVYGIVDSHQGAVEIADAPGGGALVRVRLPACDQPVVLGDAREPESAPVRGEGLVLVVDDEAMLRRAAVDVLTSLGYRAIGASNGLEGVEILKEKGEEIDVVLLDMSMPGLDGEQTYRAMRELRPNLPVLLTTGYALNEAAQAILDLGVRGFIEKPWNASRISRALARVLEDSR